MFFFILTQFLFASRQSPIKSMVHLDRRIVTSAQTFLNTTRNNLALKNKCHSCFMYNSLCICSATSNISNKYNLKIEYPNLELKIFMHYKEFGRPSNTGKLFSMMLPNNNNDNQTIKDMYIYGDDESSELANELLENNGIILFPDKESSELNPDSFSTLFGQNTTSKRNIICVLDSTWHEAKTMNKWLPTQIPRVHLPLLENEEVGESFYLTRKRVTNSNTEQTFSTIEAVGKSLDILHQSDVRFTNAFVEALKYSVDAVFKQRGLKTAFGNEIPILVSEDTQNGPFTQAKVTRPQSCPACQASHTFKNLGAPSGLSQDSMLRRWRCNSCGAIF